MLVSNSFIAWRAAFVSSAESSEGFFAGSTYLVRDVPYLVYYSKNIVAVMPGSRYDIYGSTGMFLCVS